MYLYSENLFLNGSFEKLIQTMLRYVRAVVVAGRQSQIIALQLCRGNELRVVGLRLFWLFFWPFVCLWYLCSSTVSFRRCTFLYAVYRTAFERNSHPQAPPDSFVTGCPLLSVPFSLLFLSSVYRATFSVTVVLNEPL